MKYVFWLAALFSSFTALKSLDKSHVYQFTNEPIDVVIPAIKKDKLTLDACIEGIKKYGAGIRNVYVISPEPLTNKAQWIDEKTYPFTFYDVAFAMYKDEKKARDYLSLPKNRIGWIYQQLLKLYSPYIIKGISSNILLLDADTIFLKPVSFLNEHYEPLFNPGNEHHEPYFSHAKKVIPGFNKIFKNYSGISHHMLIQKSVIDRLFEVIQLHNNVEPWKALCQHIEIFSSGKPTLSSMSEFEMYFNFIFSTTNQAHIRKFKWANIKSLKKIHEYKASGYDYISCHAFLRSKKMRFK